MTDDTTLRKDLIRLAHENPDGIRDHVLPLLTKKAVLPPVVGLVLHKAINVELPRKLLEALNRSVGKHSSNGVKVEINRGMLDIILWMRDDGDERAAPMTEEEAQDTARIILGPGSYVEPHALQRGGKAPGFWVGKTSLTFGDLEKWL